MKIAKSFQDWKAWCQNLLHATLKRKKVCKGDSAKNQKPIQHIEWIFVFKGDQQTTHLNSYSEQLNIVRPKTKFISEYWTFWVQYSNGKKLLNLSHYPNSKLFVLISNVCRNYQLVFRCHLNSEQKSHDFKSH